jgi:hypothetical protein
MQPNRAAERSFKAKLEGRNTGRVYLVLPFDPAEAWGSHTRYHVRGTINGASVRGALEKFGRDYFLPLGPVYRRGADLNLGDGLSKNLITIGSRILCHPLR